MPHRFDPLPALHEGSHVRLIAPASPFGREGFDAGVARLRARYRVSYDEGIFERSRFFAGDDARRARELAAALSDPDVDAIVAARGGYGSIRLLEIDPERVRQARKILVGFSDLTAMHALWAHAGLR